MTIQPFLQLACPLDGKALISDGASWRCSGGHCYDIARQGYTHLLPVQKMHSLNPGDSKEMIEARRRFLNAGFYEPMAAEVGKMVLDGLPAEGSVLDAGCGEGYYLRQLLAAAGEQQSIQAIGADISKPAILSAAKQDKVPNWVVASNAHLPVLTATLDRVICVFGFPTYTEFARVLKNGGELLLVEAGPGHLRQLREIIYPTVKPDKAETDDVPEGFTELAADSLTFEFQLTTAEQIADLLCMTPHLYRASAEGKAKVAELESLTLTASFQLRRFAVIERVIEPVVEVEEVEVVASAEAAENTEVVEAVETTELVEKIEEPENAEAVVNIAPAENAENLENLEPNQEPEPEPEPEPVEVTDAVEAPKAVFDWATRRLKEPKE